MFELAKTFLGFSILFGTLGFTLSYITGLFDKRTALEKLFNTGTASSNVQISYSVAGLCIWTALGCLSSAAILYGISLI